MDTSSCRTKRFKYIYTNVAKSITSMSDQMKTESTWLSSIMTYSDVKIEKKNVKAFSRENLFKRLLSDLTLM